MLRWIHQWPTEPVAGAPVVVLMHGRGADERDLLPVGQRIWPTALVLSVRAPFEAAPWGYGAGYAWYRYLGGTTPEPESFEQSQQALGEFLDTIEDRLPVPPGPLILGGFSQGGTMALGHALRHPGRVPFVLNLSGFLADHPSVVVAPETVAGAEIFWGHGTLDPSIPFALASPGQEALRAAGGDLTTPTWPMGHTIILEELAAIQAWLAARLGRAQP